MGQGTSLQNAPLAGDGRDQAHPDPFARHPELRAVILDPETSFHRDFNIDAVIDAHPELEALRRKLYSDAARAAVRAEALQGHTGDLWVFAYGSLMWDPALRFCDVRRARLDGYARKFILVDDSGGRGCKDAPGLFAGLDPGPQCHGVAFRIAAADVSVETEILFRREMIAPAYLPRMVPVVLDDGPVMALTFVADHSAPDIRLDLPHVLQVQYIATGVGFLGSSYDYLANIVDQFSLLGIEDRACTNLLRDVDDYIAMNAQREAGQ